MDYAETPRHDADLVAPVRTVNAAGHSPFAIVCDHASNRIPPAYDNLGLPASEGRLLRLDTSTISVLGHERETPVLLRWNS